jgi:hypothetical protein
MTAVGQSGLVAFGPQAGMGVDVDAGDWYFHKVLGTDLAVIDDVRLGPPTVGGVPVPDVAYKGGYNVAGSIQMNPRLKDSLGWMLYATLGAKQTTQKAIAEEYLHARQLLVGGAITINTGFGTIPLAGAKVAIRIDKSDARSDYAPTVTVTGTDSGGPATETYNFSTGPTAGQRTVGLDTIQGSSVGYQEIVGTKLFLTVTTITLTGPTNIGTDTFYISAGIEDAVAKSHVFLMDAGDLNSVLWTGFRKFIPKGSASASSIGETYKDCKPLGFNLDLPNDGLIASRIDVLGRDFLLERDPSWATGPTFEDFKSVPISSVLAGYIKAPQFGDEELPVVAASVAWTNSPLDLRMERVYGDPRLEDITVIGRQLGIQITVKWKNPELYQMVLSGSKTGTTWSSVPFTSRLDLLTASPSLIPGSLAPYSLRVQAQEAVLQMRGGITLAPQGAVMMTFSGLALDTGGTYATMELVNDVAAYTWPV